jgi:polyhydroxyalkanoate synthesis regulator phasin
LAGKDELKQAAKRVREVSRKPAQEVPTSSDAATDDVQSLRERVAALSAENLALRVQVADLQARLMD